MSDPTLDDVQYDSSIDDEELGSFLAGLSSDDFSYDPGVDDDVSAAPNLPETANVDLPEPPKIDVPDAGGASSALPADDTEMSPVVKMEKIGYLKSLVEQGPDGFAKAWKELSPKDRNFYQQILAGTLAGMGKGAMQGKQLSAEERMAQAQRDFVSSENEKSRQFLTQQSTVNPISHSFTPRSGLVNAARMGG